MTEGHKSSYLLSVLSQVSIRGDTKGEIIVFSCSGKFEVVGLLSRLSFKNTHLRVYFRLYMFYGA